MFRLLLRVFIVPVSLLCSVGVLVSCSASPQIPKINFIGIATGSLVTNLDALQFRERFDPDEQTLVGVVAFTKIIDGTRVQATWFSPDDRRMPMGRTNIVTESGAQIVRFSINSAEEWQKAPYMLRIHAFTGEGEDMLTTSGSTQFFIGMTDEEIVAYHEEYAAWLAYREEERKKEEELKEDEGMMEGEVPLEP